MIASEWKKQSLGEFITLEYGKPLDKEDRKDDGLYPAYGANGIKARSDKYYSDTESIIVGRKGAAGELTKTEAKFWPLDVTYFVKFDALEYDLTFIYHLLSQLNLPDLATGVKPGINRNRVYEIQVKTPSLPEQQRIVAILDQAFADIENARANAEQNLKNARELFDSYLQQVFSQRGERWVDSTLGEIAQVKGGKRVPKGYKFEDSETPYAYISVKDFNDAGGVDINKIKYISEEVRKQISRYIITADDLYISIAGTIGKTGIVPEALSGANLTENACKLVFNEGFSNKFIYYFTKTASFHEQALANTRTAAQPKLALERLKSIRLATPPLQDQLTLVNSLNSISERSRAVEVIYLKKVKALDELKKSLLQKAFSGELTKSKGIAA